MLLIQFATTLWCQDAATVNDISRVRAPLLLRPVSEYYSTITTVPLLRHYWYSPGLRLLRRHHYSTTALTQYSNAAVLRHWVPLLQ
eukprot:3450659-Pyramimonas_sp.AAC.1